MDIKKTGGPAYPTLTGGLLEDGVFRFEGMTLLDAYIIAFIQSGASPDEALDDALDMLDYRNEYLYGSDDDPETEQ